MAGGCCSALAGKYAAAGPDPFEDSVGESATQVSVHSDDVKNARRPVCSTRKSTAAEPRSMGKGPVQSPAIAQP